MNEFLTSLGHLHGPVVYVVVPLLVFLEAAVFVGLVVPGETAIVLAGALAAHGAVSLPLILGLGCVAAVAGDSVGYAVGRRFGPTIQTSRLGRSIGPKRWEQAHAYVQTRGAWAVAAGRWVGVLRALLPAVVGMTRMPYRRFFVANAVGGIAWVCAMVAIGYAAGDSLGRVHAILGRVSLAGAALVGVGMIVVVRARRRTAAMVADGERSADPGRVRAAARLRREYALLAVLAVAVLAVAELAEGVRERGDLSAFDPTVTADAVAARGPLLTPVAEFFTFLGSTMSLTALAAATVVWVGWRGRDRALAALLAASMAASAALTVLLKRLVERARPPAGTVLGPIDHGYAFPSGHTLNSTVFFGLLAGLALSRVGTTRARVGVIAAWLAASAAVGLSRIYLGYHWMTDVLAGFGVAVAILALTALAWSVLRIRTTRARPPSQAPPPG